MPDPESFPARQFSGYCLSDSLPAVAPCRAGTAAFTESEIAGIMNRSEIEENLP